MALCSRCRLTLLRRFQPLTSPSASLRYASTVPSSPNAPPATPPPSTTSPNAAPSATSSAIPSASQPFSTPTHSSASAVKAAKPKKPRRIPSSVAGGTALRGLGYTKAQPNVLAKEDDEYPDWLWTLLDKPADQEAAIDTSRMTKIQRAKHDRRMEKLRATLPKAIPLHEQSADLTGPEDDAMVSLRKRAEVTKSAREARRKKIREDNFLRSM